MLFGDDVRQYLADVDETAGQFYVSVQTMDSGKAKGDVNAIQRNGELLNRLSVELLQRRTAVFRPVLDSGFLSQSRPEPGEHAIRRLRFGPLRRLAAHGVVIAARPAPARVGALRAAAI